MEQLSARVSRGGKGGGHHQQIHPQTLTHALAKISDIVSSSLEGDARGLESDSPLPPLPPREHHPHLELQLGPPLGLFPGEGAG